MVFFFKGLDKAGTGIVPGPESNFLDVCLGVDQQAGCQSHTAISQKLVYRGLKAQWKSGFQLLLVQKYLTAETGNGMFSFCIICLAFSRARKSIVVKESFRFPRFTEDGWKGEARFFFPRMWLRLLRH